VTHVRQKNALSLIGRLSLVPGADKFGGSFIDQPFELMLIPLKLFLFHAGLCQRVTEASDDLRHRHGADQSSLHKDCPHPQRCAGEVSPHGYTGKLDQREYQRRADADERGS
jgi:hypothetical protein